MKTTDYHDFCCIGTPREYRTKMRIGDVYFNGAMCLRCGDLIRSKNVYDFRTCSCGSVSVDGGSDFCKRNFVNENWFKDIIIPFNDVLEDNND